MSKPEHKHRNVVFVINATYPHPLLLLDMEHDSWQHVKFCVYQRECAGHEHFQGYIEFDTPLSYKAMHKLDGLDTANFRRRFGSARQASHYATKPHADCQCKHCLEERREPTKLEGPWSIGTMSNQGQREDLLAIKRKIDQGASLKAIAVDEDLYPTWIKMPKNFETYKRISTPQRRSKPIVFLFVGPSGTGKTRTACKIARMIGTLYKVPPKSTGFWCDDYSHEDVFLIDEMSGNKMTPEFFNELVDWEPMCVPSHGSAGHQFTSPYVFITSNYHPKFWWKKRSAEQLRQTTRRIDVTIKMLKLTTEFRHTGFQEFGPNTNRPVYPIFQRTTVASDPVISNIQNSNNPGLF